MVGAGFLQTAHDGVVQAGAIADDDGADDGCRRGAPAPDGGGNGAPGEGANRAQALVGPRSEPGNVDQRAALDAADERRAAPRQRPFEVRHAGIEIARWAPQLDRETDAPAGAPPVEPLRGNRSSDRDDDSTACRAGWAGQAEGAGGAGRAAGAGRAGLVHVGAVLLIHAINGDTERHSRFDRRRVGAENALHHGERAVVFRQAPPFPSRLLARLTRELLEQRPQRRPPGLLPPGGRQEHAAGEKPGGDGRGDQQRTAEPVRQDRDGDARRQHGVSNPERWVDEDQSAG